MESISLEQLGLGGAHHAPLECKVAELVPITARLATKGRILLIDGDAAFSAEQVRRALPGFDLTVVRSAVDGLLRFRRMRPDVVLLEACLSDRSGLELLEELRAIDARVPVIFVTSAKGADMAIAAMKTRAFDYLYKPLEPAQLRGSVLEALQVSGHMRCREPAQESVPSALEEGALLGNSPAMLEVYKEIGRVAGQNVTVLITGESGTGKELVAQAIQQHSARASAAYSELNCAAIPETLLETELFGHEKGAFTGAHCRRIGRFEHHSGGTLLLDEIGDMPLSLQAKVLRLVQEQKFERAGGNETVRTDVRLIAATHHDLPTRIAEGKFRLDLYHRLGVFTIHVPPLRERGADIELLSQHFVERFSRELGREVLEIAPEAMAQLRNYSWPGNVRQLQNVLKQAVLRARGFTLLPRFLPTLALAPRPAARPAPLEEPRSCDVESFVSQRLQAHEPSDLHAETRDYVERFLFKAVLDRAQGNCQLGARMLGISRQTMRVRLRALGVSVGHTVEVDGE